ncbi:MAG: site-2 protease family protein [candidate division KSB1 bacterium]|nr:site-2 protease family protein [candidate division KSB1 bacterium]MDZ7294699.1 site-2 protease family protein [candidate division KSB1 bacterium]MDZ7384650.1 site-2 protease family protein [candidate division KSB1 bacterium]MDZ7393096.1 site-2 protease family protein [candidate division KSB1 bacterium]MDZ7412432.1 site-2 protease family protein [candidate division KSB1 bacterium]
MSYPEWVDSFPEYSQRPFPASRPSWRARLLGRLTPRRRPTLNIVLFAATVLSTLLVGGAVYCLSIMSILLAHEMGHYLMCRRHRVNATLPYFIPFPFPMLNPFGTLGAVIRMDARMPDRRALLDVAVAGPLAGLAIALPVMFFGLQNSQLVPKGEVGPSVLYLGESLLFKLVARLAVPGLSPDMDIMLGPMAFAGWAGLFVTSLNLLPIGQLDGGHVLYALFGQRAQRAYIFLLIAFGIVTVKWYPGWALLLVLLIVFGFRHPVPLDPFLPLDARRRAVGYAMLVIFMVSFTPVPFRI